MTSLQKKFVEVKSEYDEAERAVKLYERLVLSCPATAVNQLRYAGFHIIQASSVDVNEAGNEQFIIGHIEKAKEHCKRAWYDSYDGMICEQLGFIADFQEECRRSQGVFEKYPDYIADYTDLLELQAQLRSLGIVQRMTIPERDAVVSLCQRVSRLKRKILRLKADIGRVEAYADSKNGEVLAPSIDEGGGADENQLIVSVHQFLISFVSTVMGAVAGVAGMFFGLWSIITCALALKLTVIGVSFVFMYLIVMWFFGWSVKHMLTEMQRRELHRRYGISEDGQLSVFSWIRRRMCSTKREKTTKENEDGQSAIPR